MTLRGGNKNLLDPIPAWMGVVARMAVGAVLIVAGTMKAAAPAEEFALVIHYYRLPFLSDDAISSLAAFLPWIELFVGWCLAAGYFTRRAAIAAAGLFLCFVAILASVKIRGIPLPNCGCFGGAFHPSIAQGLVLDSFLFCLAFLAYRVGDKLWSLDNWCANAG
ncbi:MAG: MauE/DoxX family redox-associated membrane protein [Elusimicrobiota bacterium]